MRLRKIPVSALFGTFFVRKPDGTKWHSYYNTIDSLRPLFKDKQFRDAVDGFYLNVTGEFDSVRISYFVSEKNREKAILTFKQFFESNGLVQIKEGGSPRQNVLAEAYGGEEFEERFRDFLVLGTQIGLELMERDLLQARVLFATYRWQVRKASLPFRDHFEPTFRKYSPTYNSMSEDKKGQFLANLARWPNPPQVDWAHMMVNLVLGCDWNWVFSSPDYMTPGEPSSIAQINTILERDGLGFQIPLDWKQ